MRASGGRKESDSPFARSKAGSRKDSDGSMGNGNRLELDSATAPEPLNLKVSNHARRSKLNR